MAGEGREVVLKVPNGAGYGFKISGHLTHLALHGLISNLATAYPIQRAIGASPGKSGFGPHIGSPGLFGAKITRRLTAEFGRVTLPTDSHIRLAKRATRLNQHIVQAVIDPAHRACRDFIDPRQTIDAAF